MLNIKNPLITFCLAMACVLPGCSKQYPETENWDLVVYGATPAGIIAAVTAADHGAKVLLVEPAQVVGGMYSSGLNTAESEHMVDDAITGRARDFYVKLGELYYDSAYFQTFGNGRALDWQPGDPAFFFESRHAQALFEQMLEDAGVTVMLNTHLAATKTRGNRIVRLTLGNGRQVAGSYFTDCSYEGDLMAQAGVAFTFGREPVSQYGESLAGLRLVDDTLSARTVDENGQLLPWFNRYGTLVPGSGDQLVMNYNFRPVMTEDPDNMLPVYRPENYDSAQFQFLADFLAIRPDVRIWDLVGRYRRGNGKFEYNNQQNALVSLGMFGGNAGYTEGDYKTRQQIYQAHKDWTLGFLYFLATDSRVPADLQQDALKAGFAKDEFVRNNHFPYYLYVREGRRMLGQSVFTQHDVFRDRQKAGAVLLGSHWVDSHHVQRIALSDSTFTNEGRIWEIVLMPFEVPYSALVPKQAECANLLVPVCASFSHVAFCTFRLESTWMQAGHVAGLAAVQALEDGQAVQAIDLPRLQEQLVAEGMVIEADSVRHYNDYHWMETSEKVKHSYKRMYEEYGVEVAAGATSN